MNKFLADTRSNIGGVVGMSSVGPAVVIVTKEPKEKIEQMCKKWQFSLDFTTKINNIGLTVERVNSYKFVFVQGKL